MNQSTREAIDYLEKYLGHKVLRTKPANGDWSYTDCSPILLVGFTYDCRIRCRFTNKNDILENKVSVLPLAFTDRNWITYEEAFIPKDNALNKWIGKKIRRIRPSSLLCSRDYMDGCGYTLISASKYHMVVISNPNGEIGEMMVLGPAFVNPEDWELVE